jgi:hypothetical protein
MIVFMLLGLPIAFSIGMAGMIGIFIITGDLNMIIGIVGMASYTCVASYIFSTVPMFLWLSLPHQAG